MAEIIDAAGNVTPLTNAVAGTVFPVAGVVAGTYTYLCSLIPQGCSLMAHHFSSPKPLLFRLAAHQPVRSTNAPAPGLFYNHILRNKFGPNITRHMYLSRLRRHYHRLHNQWCHWQHNNSVL